MAVHAELAELYRRRIRSGEIGDGERLPIEQELAELHGVSIATISRAVKILKAEGLLHTTHAGTFAGPRPPDPRTRQEQSPPRICCANQPWCNNFIELKASVNLGVLLRQVGWIWRGTRQGRSYFCDRCAPEVLIRETKES